MRESDKLYKRDLHQSMLYHCNRIYNIHIFVDMKCSTWCLEIKQGNQTLAQWGPIAFQCLQGEESCAPWRGRLPAVQRGSPVPGAWGGPSFGKGSPSPGKVGWEAGGSLLSDTSQAGSQEKAISPSINGDTKKPGGCAGHCVKVREALERLVERTVAGGIEESKRKSSL